MALTNEDLMAISDLLDIKLKSALDPVKSEIHDLRQHVDMELNDLRTEFSGLKAEFNNLRQHVDREISGLRQHVDREISGLRQHMDTEIYKLRLHIENVTDKNIQVLAENYVSAAKRYEKAVPVIEAMEVDIGLMKKVIREHSGILQRMS